MDFKREINLIKKRNRRVELDKKWETSIERKIAIAFLTYVIIVLIFTTSNVPNAFFNALIPTIGFLLSTLTLDFLKQQWINPQNLNKKFKE